MQNSNSNFRTLVQWLRRSWIPLAVIAFAAVALLAGQPVWAADGANIGQTVPTPTPTIPPVAPTATPAPAATSQPTPDDGGATEDSPADSGPADSGVADSGVDPGALPPPAAVGAEAPAATFTSTLTGTVTALTLNVRQGPGPSFAVIGRLTAGANVTVLARNLDGEWLLVCCTPAGSNGWVAAQYIEPGFSAAEAASLSVTDSIVTTSTVTSAITGTVTPATTPLSGEGTVNVLTLNIRQGPSTTATAIGRFRQGDTVTLQGANAAGDWYLVCCIPGTQNPGWVSAQFVTVAAATAEEPAPATTPTPEADTTETEAAEATPTPAAPEEGADSQSSQSNTGVADVLW